MYIYSKRLTKIMVEVEFVLKEQKLGMDPYKKP